MAFASAILGRSVFGDKSIVWGSFTNGAGDSGGDIETGLASVENIQLQHSGAAAVADSPSVNETLPLASGDVTIVTTTGADGYWFAIGTGGR